MWKVAPLIILWCALPALQSRAHAAPPTSDWPSLNADAAQSNYNSTELTISAKNFLKLKRKWVYPGPQCSPSFPMSGYDASYPIVGGGHVFVPIQSGYNIHVRELDALTGKCITRFSKDAQGGMLWSGTTLYVAGKHLQAIDPATGRALAKIDAAQKFSGSIFVKPLADKKLILSGFANRIQSKIYTLDAATNTVLHRLPSASASAAVTSGRVMTSTLKGSILYDEASGRALARPPYFGSNWFAGTDKEYMVASPPGKGATLFGFDSSGRKLWSHTVGPVMAAQSQDWPHAVGPDAVYVTNFRPHQGVQGEGVQAIDPTTGHALWTLPLANVNQLALANDVLFALTYSLGQPVRVVAIHPKTGKTIGAIVLSSGYYGFFARDGLMVANGMVFVRVQGPQGSQIVALGL